MMMTTTTRMMTKTGSKRLREGRVMLKIREAEPSAVQRQQKTRRTRTLFSRCRPDRVSIRL